MTRHAGRLVALTLAFACVTGCYGFLPAPVRKDRVREATEQAKKRCDAQPVDPRIFGEADIESVEPLYAYVQTAGNREARLLGAALRLRPLPGFTSELVAHVLACRSAELVLGRVQGAENDPYWLPDGWVKVGVRSDDGSFVVALEGEDIVEAREIRASAGVRQSPSSLTAPEPSRNARLVRRRAW